MQDDDARHFTEQLATDHRVRAMLYRERRLALEEAAKLVENFDNLYHRMTVADAMARAIRELKR